MNLNNCFFTLLFIKDYEEILNSKSVFMSYINENQ